MTKEMSCFSPGQTAVFREIYNGKIYRGGSYVIVQDKPEMLALYAPLGTTIRYPLTPDGSRVKPRQKKNGEWVLTDFITDKRTSLRLAIPGESYSVFLFWDQPGFNLDYWYINLENPMRRVPTGFDCLDQWLDVIVSADLSSWHWKDEDEFAEAIELGIISQEKAKAMRLEGERAAAWIVSGKSPFNAWEKWRPDPSWEVPVLPEGWDKI